MAERQVLLDAVFVGRMHRGAAPQTAASLGVLGLHQMPPASALAQHFAAGRDFEPLGRGLFRFNAFWTSHNDRLSLKKSAQYRSPPDPRQEVFSFKRSNGVNAPARKERSLQSAEKLRSFAGSLRNETTDWTKASGFSTCTR